MNIPKENPIVAIERPNLNEITATLKDGTKIEASRCVDGWRVEVEIVINGIVWLRAPDHAAGKQAFEDLAEAHQTFARANRAKAEKAAYSIGKRIFPLD